MVVSIIAILFVGFVLILALCAKSILYVNERESSILDELKKFDENIKVIEQITEISEYSIGSEHIYK